MISSIVISGWAMIRAIVEKLFTSRGKKMYNESEVKKDVKQ